MKIKQVIKEKRLMLIIFIWIIAILGYILLWWSVLPITSRTGIILLGLLMGIPALTIGLTKRLDSAFFGLALFIGLLILLLFSEVATRSRDHRWREWNKVWAHERAVAFNQSQLESRIVDRRLSSPSFISWHQGLDLSLIVMTRPNYRFTREELEELGRIAHEVENLYEDANFRGWEDRILILYSLDRYWLRTYTVESAPLTMTRKAGLSTIYGVEENIAVVEVRFPWEMAWGYVLRLPLVDQHGKFHGENFQLALQLQQLMLAELIEGAEETRSFELAREVLAELER